MIKKIKIFFFSIVIMLGFTGCVESKTTYSFKEMTNKEITDICSVSISYGPMQSSILKFDGHYEKILDVDYILSDLQVGEIRKIIEDYRFHLYVDFNSNNSKTDDFEFYVYNDKLYYFSDSSLYESKETINDEDYYTNKESMKTWNLNVSLDYGMYLKEMALPLVDSNLIWFDIHDYGIDTLVAGDELIISYTGEVTIKEVYPGIVDDEKMQIQSINVIEADIIEFEITSQPNDDIVSLISMDLKYDIGVQSSDGSPFVVLENGNYIQCSNLPTGTKVYGSVKKMDDDKISVEAFYSYYPRKK